MSPVNVNLTEEQVSVSVSGDDITATVSGGIGPSGLQGPAATIAVGTVTTGAPGSSASVVNSGTSGAAVFDFTIPAGPQGPDGPRGLDGPRGFRGFEGATGAAGAAATISVGTVTTGAAGSSASVTNSGTTSAAVFDFTIPAGATGATGPAGPATTDASLLTAGTLNEARLPGSVVLTTDSRLTDARTPTAHKASHSTGGSDAIAPSDIGAANATHPHAASDINSGTLSIDRIPTGTTSTTVAAGNHTHSQLHDRSHAITSTSDHTAGNWKVLYSNGSGEVVELALGASGTVLQSGGTSAAPTFGSVQKTIASGTAAPTGGVDGDIYLQYTA